MHYDCFIVGQGIAGTLLSYELVRAGCRVKVFDVPNSRKASLVSGALINPVNVNTGKRVEQATTMLQTARICYDSMSALLNISLTEELLLFAFTTGTLQHNEYVSSPSESEQTILRKYFHIDRNWSRIAPVVKVHAEILLGQWRDFLFSKHALSDAFFDIKKMKASRDHVAYGNDRATRIVFCGGAADRHLPVFSKIKFTPNRGDVLLIEIKNNPLPQYVFQLKKIKLIPIDQNRYWCGSNYRWVFEDRKPDLAWRRETEQILKQYLKMECRVLDHLVAERPTIAGQVPVAKFIDNESRIGVLNGLGTRGYSLGPSLAQQMCDTILKLTLP